MPRYIDAERTQKDLEIIKETLPEGRSQLAVTCIDFAINILEASSTADVAPLRHGNWIPKKEMIRSPEEKNYNCSACGKESFAYPNCPFCRAIMYEEVKHNEQ